MRLHFYSGNRIEPWDYRNVRDIGIGGSETSHVELALRLAARGYDVTSYTDLPADCPDTHFGGVHWLPLAAADFRAAGLWIIYRQPSLGARLQPAADRRYWLVCQDVFYPDWDSAAVAAFERVLGLCPRHVADLEARDPANAGRVCLSSNGVNVDRIVKAEGESPARHPQRVIWASSPDRGLREALDIFERAREQLPELELHVFYGMDNIERICGGDRRKMPWRLSWQQYDRACRMPGVTWRGRVGQEQLAREWLSAGIWLYPTWFSETSCIACMEAQACGAIPITNPIWATGYNVRHGVFIEGQPNDPLVKARYVEALVAVAADLHGQEMLRGRMMHAARRDFDWRRVADQWEAWIGARPGTAQPVQEAHLCC